MTLGTPSPSPESTSSGPAIRIERLTKRFGRTVAVDDLSLDVVPGEVFGFLGPNGAGKSTTIRLVLGMLRPTRGRVQVFGVDAGDVGRAHRLLGYVPADVALWPSLTGAEILGLTASLGPATDTSYRDVLIERFALDVDRRASTYSSGNRQKVALIAAFAARPRLLVLDEPTSGLDPLVAQEFRRCVAEARERGQTVFLSSHQLSEVETVCDRVGILRAGRLVEVAGLAELRRLRRTELEASFDSDPSALDALAALPGVEHVDRSAPGIVRVSLTGAPGALLHRLSDESVTGAHLVRLDVRESTLEEIFLGYYGDDGNDGNGGNGGGEER